LRRSGRPKALASWQTDFKADWVYHTKPDEQRQLERELKWRKTPLKTKNRAERLAQLEAEAERKSGTYHTDIHRWTCSCPAFLISRFLLCKHLVRAANSELGEAPLTDLRFFLNIHRHHLPPFYHIPGIHPVQGKPSSTQQQEPPQILLELDPLVSEMSGGGDGEDDGGGAVSDGVLEETVADNGGVEMEEEMDVLDNYIRSSSPGFARLLDDHSLDDDVSEGDDAPNVSSCFISWVNSDTRSQIHYTDARREDLKRKFDAMLEETKAPNGVHHKTSRIFERVFKKVEKVGGEIESYRQRRKRQRTWKDHNENTMYLN